VEQLKGLERLEVIYELSRKNPEWKHKELFKILRKEDIWIAAYENIKANKGALTPGVTKETLNGMGLERLQRLQSKVLKESYKFSPVKQTWIPKANGDNRPLGIPTSNDKIVQEVIRMVLEAIYEPIFDHRSFGFRKSLGVHDALQYVENQFRWMDWVIEGDIKSAYPTVNHNRLCEIIGQRIEDVRFMNLIRKSLKGGIFVSPNTIYSSLGVPQGSIVAPIYANIYFNELDKWVQQKAGQIFEINSKARNPEYRKLEYRIRKLGKTLEGMTRTSQEHKELVQQIKGLIQLRSQTSSLLNLGIETRYTRYADDWIIGIRGPERTAIDFKKELESFLKSHLEQELHPEKTKITNLRAGKVSFLGYDIFLPRNMKIGKYKIQGGKQTMRRSPPTLRFHLPVDQVIKRMKERGYITYDKNNKIRPISKGSYTPLEDVIIVNHFRSVWLGLKNFYSGSTNRSHLQYIHYLLHISCAMTLAHRHRSSTSKIMKKHGKRLEIMDNNVNPPQRVTAFPYQSKWKVSDRKWQCATKFKDPFRMYSNRVSKSCLGKSCFLCQATEQIEMYHVKHVRKQGYRYRGFQPERALLNRKQVPLCRDCHILVHTGLYDNKRLSTVDL
jgi:group II intron reverse transcriptase/maturase